MTRTELLDYVDTLEDPLPQIFRLADLMVRDSADTLSEEFQLAASIVRDFEERAAASAARRRPDGD